MKKWNRISICLILAACLLLLPACKGWKTPPVDDPQQSTGQHDEDAAQQKLSSGDNNETQTVPLTWKVSSVNTYCNIKAEDSAVYRMTYEMWNSIVSYSIQKHTYCSTDCYLVPGSQKCAVADYFDSTSYSEAYFTENTLLLVDLRLDQYNTFSVKDVRYKDGVVTCAVEIEKPREMVINNFWCVFVEVESVLPTETQIELEVTSKTQENDTV